MILGVNSVFLLGNVVEECPRIIRPAGESPKVEFTLTVTNFKKNEERHTEFIKILARHESLVNLFIKEQIRVGKNSLVLINGKIHNRNAGERTENVVLANLIKVMRDHAYMTMRDKTDAIKQQVESGANPKVIVENISELLSGISFGGNEMEAS